MELTNAGSEVLLEAYDLVTGDRQKAYDHPLEDYQRTVNIFNAMYGADIMTAEDGAIFMICVKLSRLMNEIEKDLYIPDNTRDGAGYMAVLNMIREARRQHQKELDELMATVNKKARR